MIVVGWIVYAILGAVFTLGAFMGGLPWFALAVALCFIFGPKVWKSL